jgi:hypothetical protein
MGRPQPGFGKPGWGGSGPWLGSLRYGCSGVLLPKASANSFE